VIILVKYIIQSHEIIRTNALKSTTNSK